VPLDLDYADDDDSIKRHKFVWHAGEVGVPRSDAATAGELLKFLYWTIRPWRCSGGSSTST